MQNFVVEEMRPKAGVSSISFATQFPQSYFRQFCMLAQRHSLSLWRAPIYNMTRFAFTLGIAFLFGLIMLGLGRDPQTTVTVFNLVGSKFLPVLKW